jgi:hypothetical protein
MSGMDTKSDVEILEGLDFDPDLACEVEHNGRHCGAVAAYVARTVCCSRSHLMCQGCGPLAEGVQRRAVDQVRLVPERAGLDLR